MIVVLFSGGLDSTTLAHLAQVDNKLHSLLFVSYGQAAGHKEYGAAIDFAQRHRVKLEHKILPIHGLTLMNGDDLGPRVVAGRNLILLSIASNYAASVNATEIWYGATADDHEYYDCTPEFFAAASKLIKSDTGIDVCAPLLYRSKQEVLLFALELGVDLDKVWYCYNPNGDEPCGTCGACAIHPKEEKHPPRLFTEQPTRPA